jgi:hypothetical protein
VIVLTEMIEVLAYHLYQKEAKAEYLDHLQISVEAATVLAEVVVEVLAEVVEMSVEVVEVLAEVVEMSVEVVEVLAEVVEMSVNVVEVLAGVVESLGVPRGRDLTTSAWDISTSVVKRDLTVLYLRGSYS